MKNVFFNVSYTLSLTYSCTEYCSIFIFYFYPMAIDGKELGRNSCKNIPMDIKHIMDFPVIPHKVWSGINHFAD